MLIAKGADRRQDSSSFLLVFFTALFFPTSSGALDPDSVLREVRERESRERDEAQLKARKREEAQWREQQELATPGRYTYKGHDDGIVVDEVTNLEWMRCSFGQTWDAMGATCQGDASKHTWNDAMLQPKLMNDAGGYGGYTDWRVPTIDELQTLVFCSSGRPEFFKNNPLSCSGAYQQPTIFAEAFPGTPVSRFWSSSSYAGGSASAWHVNFNAGGDGWLFKNLGYRLRLVRGGGVRSVPVRPSEGGG